MSKNLAIVEQRRMMSLFDYMDISESTKQDYLQRLPRFIRFAEQNGINRDLLLNYKQALRNDVSLGVAAKNKHLVAARLALRELHRRGNLAIDLSTGVKSFRQSVKHKVTGPNDDEVAKICQHLQSLDDSFPSIRLRAIAALLLFQGLRQIEICRLDVSDVDIPNQRLFVLGKGEDDREPIKLHPTTLSVLRKYLRASQVKFGPLFTHLNRQSGGQRLTTRGLRQIFQNLLKELNIDRTTHSSRHFYTTRLIRHYKSDLATVAKFTRHQSINMLTVYNDDVLSESQADELGIVFDYDL